MKNIYIIDCESRQPWEPVNVDGVGLEDEFYLVRSAIKDGIVTYIDRVEVTLRKISPRHLVDEAGNEWRWHQLEVYLPNSQDKIHKRHDMVVARNPYSLGMLGIAPFKPSRRESITLPECKSVEQAIAFVESISQDGWDKGSNLIASIAKPTDNHFKLNIRNIRKKAKLIFGVCENFDEYVEHMMTEVSIQRFIEKADMDELKLIGRKYYSEIPSSIKQKLETIMRLSIQQALAGPYENYDLWLGGPVSKFANSIFCEHINTRIKAIEYAYDKLLKTRSDPELVDVENLINIFSTDLMLYIAEHQLLKNVLAVIKHDEIHKLIKECDVLAVGIDYMLQALSEVILQYQYTECTWDAELIVNQTTERFNQLTENILV